MRNVTVAATQFACTASWEENVAKAEKLVREAAAKGAQIILLQELFSGYYFCQEQKQEYFSLAEPFASSKLIAHFQKVAKELNVVLPISFFEKANCAYYNSIAIVDADGSVLGLYRKSHIPDGPGYQEKFYFNPGDTGFKVWDTKYAKIGVAICWDQWFPEAARIMALKGAEILFYPTAIGSEPQDASLDSHGHWRRVMCGHAGANYIPLVASNRVGKEVYEHSFIKFYGTSFICDPTGDVKTDAQDEDNIVLTQTFDLDSINAARSSWGQFRYIDRRPQLYKPLLTLDGQTYTKEEY
ncbi:hypothetical protein WA158_003059 [Blastocystis sp. Blastoise]